MQRSPELWLPPNAREQLEARAALVQDVGKTLEYAKTAEWQTFPPLAIAENDLYLPGTSREDTPDEVYNEAHAMMNKVAGDFASIGCPVYRGGEKIPEEYSERAQAIGITFLGRLPDEAVANLEDPTLDHDQVIKLNQDIIPQADSFYRIAVVRQGRKVECNNPGNFRSITMIEDPTGIVKSLSLAGYEGDFDSDHRLEGLIRQILARHGSLSTVLRTWRRQEDTGQIEFDDPILCTLEGAHPRVTNSEELSVRLMEIGSTPPVEIEKKNHPRRKESVIERRHNPHVGYLQNFMWYLGNAQKSFAAPILIEDMVSTQDPFFLEKLIEFITWAGQAEGAGEIHDPEIDVDFWSASGRFEAVKPDLKFDDIIETVSLPKNWDGLNDEEMALRIIRLAVSRRFANGEIFTHKFPSVESGPITWASRKLRAEIKAAIKRGEVPSLNSTRIPGEGYVMDKNGKIFLDPIAGVIHTHRTYEVRGSNISQARSNLKRYPGVPCGTEGERKMFYDFLKNHWLDWEATGRKTAASVAYMPGHGSLIIVGNQIRDDETAVHNPFEPVREAFDAGEVVQLDGVYQDNSKYAVDNYYEQVA